MPRIEEPALIMKCTPYRETSAMISLFTEHHGRLTAVYKGYRRRKQVALIEPFTLAEVVLVGRGSMPTLVSWDVVERFSFEGDALACAFYVYELLNRALGEQLAETRIFHAAIHTLGVLHTPPFAPALRAFERLLLDELGYGLSFDFELDGESLIVAEASYAFIPESGFTRASNDADEVFSGAALMRVAQHCYDTPAALYAARTIYHRALAAVVGDQPLVSRALLAQQHPAGPAS